MPDDAQHGDPIRPYDARMLDVGDGHWLYLEQVGRSDGIPALFLHGGPGSGAQHAHRRLFDPARFRAVLFDQRGSGRSHPYLRLTANTTAHLIADIEAIRKHLGIECWLVVGGSWGSTLAIAYAETFPSRVTGLVLRAVFLGTRAEYEWAFLDGPNRFRPELFDDFLNVLPVFERADPLAAYARRLADPDPAIHAPAAHAWFAYERALSELRPSRTRLPDPLPREGRLPPTPFVEAHYLKNDCFLEPGQLLRDANKLAGVSGRIIQSRFDLLCPPQSAYALARVWEDAKISFVEGAGHALSETGVEEAMRCGVEELSA